MKMTSLVYVRCCDLKGLAVKAEERADGDVTIMIRSPSPRCGAVLFERNEHLALHTTDDGILITKQCERAKINAHGRAKVTGARLAVGRKAG
jgi:hypothetical protein